MYLNYTEVRSQNLQNLQDRLLSEMNVVKTNLSDTLDNGCLSTDTACDDLKQDINGLDMGVDYTLLDNITAQRVAVEQVVNNDFMGKIIAAEANLDEVSAEVDNQTRDEVSNTSGEITKAVEDLRKSVEKYEEEIVEAYDFEDAKKSIENAEDDVEQYGNYRYYAGIAIACVLLLVILMLYLGLLFGIFGNAPDEYDERTCTSATGADFLMAGVGFMFIFSMILMFICMLLFLLGGLGYTEVCRYLVHDKGLDNSEAIKELDKILEENRSNDTDDLDISLSTILSGCKANQAIYTVLNIDAIFNLTDALNIEQYGIEDALDQFSTVSFEINAIDIYTTEMETDLQTLKDAGLDNIDFNAFREILDDPITDPDLVTLANDVEDYANTLPAAQDSMKAVLMAQAAELKRLSSSTVSEITNEKNSLLVHINNLENEIKPGGERFEDRVDETMLQLQQAEDYITQHGANTVFTLVGNFTKDVLHEAIRLLDSLVHSLHNDIAKCEPVYIILDTSIDSVCVNVLEPWNGFWFALGWCLIFFIPSIILASALATLYRTPFASYRHHAADGKDFEDANYDLYTGTHDNIPLHDRKQRNGYYNQNTGYEHDYTASRSANYRADSQYPGAYPNAPPQSPPHYGNDSYQYYN